MIGFLLFCSTFATLVLGEHCAIVAGRNLDECDALLGYNNGAVVGQTGDVWNFSQLINYCRMPGRQDMGQCWTSAIDGCGMAVGEQELALYTESLLWRGKAVDYICSEVDVLKRYEVCLSQVNDQITQCIRSNFRSLNAELMRREHNTGDRINATIRFGQLVISCLSGVTRQCSSQLVQIFENFYYGFEIYFLEEKMKGNL